MIFFFFFVVVCLFWEGWGVGVNLMCTFRGECRLIFSPIWFHVITPFHWPAPWLRWQNWFRSPRRAMDRCTVRRERSRSASKRHEPLTAALLLTLLNLTSAEQGRSTHALWRSDKKRHRSAVGNQLSQQQHLNASRRPYVVAETPEKSRRNDSCGSKRPYLRYAHSVKKFTECLWFHLEVVEQEAQGPWHSAWTEAPVLQECYEKF